MKTLILNANSDKKVNTIIVNRVKKFKDIWICKRIDIANHWIKN